MSCQSLLEFRFRGVTCIMQRKRVVESSIYTMADASQLAYAAVSYVWHEDKSREVTVRFVAAKAKVAPTKASIPRLELMAAVLGVRSWRKVAEL